MTRSYRTIRPAALFGIALLVAGLSGPAAADEGYADCAANTAGIDAARLRQAILAAARPRTGATTFFTDNVVVVAPVALRRGSRDLLAYIAGPRICGTGGCNGYVFEGTGRTAYRPLGRIVPARLPIRVLDTVHNGRRDLGVTVSGGGIGKGYVGALAFDGKAYAGNPTLPGIRHSAAGLGTVAIGLPGRAAGQCRLR